MFTHMNVIKGVNKQCSGTITAPLSNIIKYFPNINSTKTPLNSALTAAPHLKRLIRGVPIQSHCRGYNNKATITTPHRYFSTTKNLYHNRYIFNTTTLHSSPTMTRNIILSTRYKTTSLRQTRVLRQETSLNQSNHTNPNNIQPNGQQVRPVGGPTEQFKVPIDPVTGKPLNSLLPQHLVPSSPHNPFKSSPNPSQIAQKAEDIAKVAQKIGKKQSWLMYTLKSLLRISIIAGIIGGWSYVTFYINPKLLARVVGMVLMNSELNYCIEPEHEEEYFYPLNENDRFVPLTALYKSYQQDIVKKLFHILKELNHMETNYAEICERLSLHYREILKVRAYKIDDLDLWLLPLHLTKSQKRIRHELSVDPNYPAQIDLDVIDYLRTEAMWTYWDIITTKIDHVAATPSNGTNNTQNGQYDDAEIKKMLRDLIELKHDIDHVIDIVDLTTLVAYETKLFTYQYIPQTQEEMNEWEQFKAIEREEKQRGGFNFMNEKGDFVSDTKDTKNPLLSWFLSFYPTRNIFNITFKPDERADDIRDTLGLRKYDEESPAIVQERKLRRELRSEKSLQRVDSAVRDIQGNISEREQQQTVFDNEEYVQQRELQWKLLKQDPNNPQNKALMESLSSQPDVFKRNNQINDDENDDSTYNNTNAVFHDDADFFKSSHKLSVMEQREKELLQTDSYQPLFGSRTTSVFSKNNNEQSSKQNDTTSNDQSHQRKDPRGRYVDKYTDYGKKDLMVSFSSDANESEEMRQVDLLPAPSQARQEAIMKQQREAYNRQQLEEIREQMHNPDSKASIFAPTQQQQQQRSAGNNNSNKYRDLENRLIHGTSGSSTQDVRQFEQLSAQQKANMMSSGDNIHGVYEQRQLQQANTERNHSASPSSRFR